LYYHALFSVADGGNFAITDADLTQILSELVVPFINKQVVPTNLEGGRAILNLGTVTTLQLFKSEEEIGNDIKDADLIKKLKSPEFKEKECTQEIIDLELLNKSSRDSKSLIQNAFTPLEKQVFVIMKFNDKALDSAYEGVIKKIAKSYKYRAFSINEIQDSGKINEQILEEISKSEIVLADLTGERPNCYYEAGFAHAIGREIIFTIKKGTPIHFDLNNYRFIEWETENELRIELNKRFKAISKKKIRK